MEMNEEKVLVVENLSVLMKDRFLVRDVSFSLNQGDTLGIIGEEKSGKSSLIKTIIGTLPISDGKIYVYGNDIQEYPEILHQVGLCLDPPVFFKFQSIFDNIVYLCSLAGKVDKQKIVEVLNKFHLAEKMHKKVWKLSFYEKKCMALALAFINEPRLLILDEPFKSLPVQSVQRLRHYIEELKEKNTTIVMTAKKYDSLEDQCDYYMFMSQRKVVNLLPRKQCEKFSTSKTYAFIEVKYPHYCGKMIAQEFGYRVKIMNKRVLFEADEDATAEIVKYFTNNNLSVYSAGYISSKSERIFASLTPYFKEN